MKRKLTNKEIIDICEKVIIIVKRNELNGWSIYLCNETAEAISDTLDIEYCGNDVVDYYIPEFTKENAIEHANAINNYDNTWWYIHNYSDRIKFMEWIKSQYQNK